MKITQEQADRADASIAQPGGSALYSKIRSPADSGLDQAVSRCFGRLTQSGTAHISRVATVALSDYPEGAVLPDADRMATLVLSIENGVAGSAFVSFRPEHALDLIRAWCGADANGEQALVCYQRGTRALAEAALDAFGLEAGAAHALEEDALVATLHATHAPADTGVFTAEIQVDLGEGELTGVFVLLAETKVLGELAA